jgi:hypothetical protein
MAEQEAELLNVYDAAGRVVGQRPRAEAKRGGLAVGAVNALVRNGAGAVLLQRRPLDKENGGLWDKTVGGHVSAGESFDDTVVREAGEELFDDGGSTRVALARDAEDFALRLAAGAHRDAVVLVRAGLHLNLRDVRRAPGGGLRNVTYHVASYLGRTELELAAFRPQPSEIDELRFFSAAEVDAMLLAGGLAPNMAFLWLARGHELLA